MITGLKKLFIVSFLLCFSSSIIFPIKTYAFGCSPQNPSLPFSEEFKKINNNDIVIIGKIVKTEPAPKESPLSGATSNNNGNFLIPNLPYSEPGQIVTISNVFHIKGDYQKAWISNTKDSASLYNPPIPLVLNGYYMIFGFKDENTGSLRIANGACETITEPLGDFTRRILYTFLGTTIILLIIFFLTKPLIQKLLYRNNK